MKSRGVLRFYRLYQTAMARHPFLVDAVQTGTLMGVGDILAQTVIEKKPFQNLNVQRTLRFASIGFFMGGPVLRLWFGILHKRFGVDKDNSGLKVAVKKVFLDQVIFAPLYLIIILECVGISQGKNWDAIQKDVENNFVDVLKLNYLIWPIVQLVNFYYVPIEYQVLVGSTVALIWDTYLSWKINKSTIHEDSNKK